MCGTFMLIFLLLFIQGSSASTSIKANKMDETRSATNGHAIDYGSINEAIECCKLIPHKDIICRNCRPATISKDMNHLFVRIPDSSYVLLKIINMQFDNDTLPAYWFSPMNPPSFRLWELQIDVGKIKKIEANAFNGTFFRYLNTMVLAGTSIEIISSGSFNGLHSLRSLKLTEINVKAFVADLFAPFEVINNIEILSATSVEIQFTDLLISIQATAIRIFSMEGYNLTSSPIRTNTFSQFKQLKILVLSTNQITAIEKGSFNSFANTLDIINLRNNLLKTIPDDLFPPNFLNDAFHSKYVSLYGNPLDCTCKLNYLKNFYLHFRNQFPVAPRCHTPLNFQGKRLMDVEFCVNGSDVTQSTPTATESTTSSQICLNHKLGNMPLRKLRISLTVFEHPRGNLMLYMKHFPVNHTLILYESKSFQQIRTTNLINCLTMTLDEGNSVINLTWRGGTVEQVYTLCVIKNTEVTVNPVNCISFGGKNWERKSIGETTFTAVNILYPVSFGIISFLAGNILIFLLCCRRSSSKTPIPHELTIIRVKNEPNTYVTRENMKPAGLGLRESIGIDVWQKENARFAETY